MIWHGNIKEWTMEGNVTGYEDWATKRVLRGSSYDMQGNTRSASQRLDSYASYTNAGNERL